MSVTDSKIENMLISYIKGVPVISPATEKIILKSLIVMKVKVPKITIVNTVVMTASKAANPLLEILVLPNFLRLQVIGFSPLTLSPAIA